MKKVVPQKKPRITPITPARRKASDFDRLWKPWAAAAGGSALIATAIWGIEATRTHLRLTEAEAEIKKGFTALAAETIDPVRDALTSSARGCRALVDAYYGARRPDRLEWASQACITAGVETPEIYLGLAAARELTDRDNEALQLLQTAARKFDKSPDPLYRIAQILRRNKKDSDAADVLLKASERAPENNQLVMEAMEQLAIANRWNEARRMADKIKSVETDSPEIKLLIARALLKGGDPDGARAVVAQARTLMSKRPEIKAALEQVYGDVLNAGSGSAPAASDASRGLASPQ